ncbi:MAG: FdhD protein, partial [Sulfurimonas sp.]
MDQIITIETTKIKGSEKFTTEDTVIREIKLNIIVNDKKVASMMAVPLDLEELAVG